MFFQRPFIVSLQMLLFSSSIFFCFCFSPTGHLAFTNLLHLLDGMAAGDGTNSVWCVQTKFSYGTASAVAHLIASYRYVNLASLFASPTATRSRVFSCVYLTFLLVPRKCALRPYAGYGRLRPQLFNTTNRESAPFLSSNAPSTW